MPFALTNTVLLTLLLGGCDDGPTADDTDPTDADGDGWTVTDGDCDDGDPSVYPGAEEVVADGVDQDCDGGDACFQDHDGDGSGSSVTVVSEDLDCADGGESPVSTDCDDDDSEVHPGADEVVADGIDQNCNGGDLCYADEDGDGYGTTQTVSSTDLDCMDSGETTFSNDCDDTDPAVSPDASEICNDVDDDCDGVTDDGLLCEDCSNGIDDDKDGLVDCEDGDCDGRAPCAENCTTSGDDDGDGVVNCRDDDCWSSGDCVMASRVRQGDSVWWLWRYNRHGEGGGGYATSIDGTLWIHPVSPGVVTTDPISCPWHVDHVHFNTDSVFREGFALSPACPLPEDYSRFLAVPVARQYSVAGRGEEAYSIGVNGWYTGEANLLVWDRGHSGYSHVWYRISWSISPIEPGNTFEIQMLE